MLPQLYEDSTGICGDADYLTKVRGFWDVGCKMLLSTEPRDNADATRILGEMIIDSELGGSLIQELSQEHIEKIVQAVATHKGETAVQQIPLKILLCSIVQHKRSLVAALEKPVESLL